MIVHRHVGNSARQMAARTLSDLAFPRLFCCWRFGEDGHWHSLFGLKAEGLIRACKQAWGCDYLNSSNLHSATAERALVPRSGSRWFCFWSGLELAPTSSREPSCITHSLAFTALLLHSREGSLYQHDTQSPAPTPSLVF